MLVIYRGNSRYVWYSISEGAKYDVEVFKKKLIASPLIQGGLAIPIKVSVAWDSPENLSILMEKVKDVQYPVAGAYTDNSKEILKGTTSQKLTGFLLTRKFSNRFKYFHIYFHVIRYFVTGQWILPDFDKFLFGTAYGY